MPEETRAYSQLSNLESKTLRDFAKVSDWRLVLKVEPAPTEETEATDDRFALIYFRAAAETKPSGFAVPLTDHLSAVADMAQNLGAKLGLPKDIVQALRLAGTYHDCGKQERIWQLAAGNTGLATPVAKPKKPMRPHDLNGFRHELASLRYAEEKLQAESASPEVRELALHLIAAHHGHARPCFARKTYSRESYRESERLASETARRFGRLQERYGPWGLAYLEAIFKSADALASAEAEEQPDYA